MAAKRTTSSPLEPARVAAGMKRLLIAEGLDDLDQLLVDRAWDEVPFVSRYARLAFLRGADVDTRCRLLVAHATRHLDEVLRHRDLHRPEVLVMLSVSRWDNLQESPPDPVVPCFWISTQPARDLVSFRLTPGAQPAAARVAAWLDAEGLLAEHEVFDNRTPDPSFERVYVARRDDPRVEPLVVR